MRPSSFSWAVANDVVVVRKDNTANREYFMVVDDVLFFGNNSERIMELWRQSDLACHFFRIIIVLERAGC